MTIVNHETGEITEVPSTTLATIDKSAVSVVTLLEQAKSWLATCVEMTGPAEIAAAKAQIVTAETYARELNLSKEIQLDAAEMVRRAEYSLGQAIRRGQAEGLIAKRGEVRNAGFGEDTGPTRNFDKASPYDFAKSHELSGIHGNGGIYDMADNASPDEFDAALEAAKAEGNLSRANVVRKIKGQPSPGVITRDMRAEMIAALAEQGYSSRQMVEKVGVTEETIRIIARDFEIEIPADKVLAGRHSIQHTESVDRFVTKIENTVSAFQYVDLNEVDFSQADDWVASLTASISALNRIKKQLAKEATHV